MSFYGFVSPGIRIITANYDDIRDLIDIVQYPKFMKFRTKDEAIKFVADNTMEFRLQRLKKYGECFDNLYATVEYFISGTSVYYNVFTDRLGNVDLSDTIVDDSMIVERRNGLLMIEIKEINLDNNLIMSHAIAIQKILEILGTFIDVELVIPNHSIYYLINSYSGDYRPYRRVIDFINSRKGRLCLTMDNWGGMQK